MFNPVRVGKRTRYSYARIKEVMEMPHLLDIQRNSYDWFINEGLAEILKDISPISDFTGDLELFFKDFSRGEPKYSLEECKERDVTYAAPIKVNVNLVSYKKNPDGTKEIQEVKQQSVFMGAKPALSLLMVLNVSLFRSLLDHPVLIMQEALILLARLSTMRLLFLIVELGLNLRLIPLTLSPLELIVLVKCR